MGDAPPAWPGRLKRQLEEAHGAQATAAAKGAEERRALEARVAIHKSDAGKQRAMAEREAKHCEAQKQVRPGSQRQHALRAGSRVGDPPPAAAHIQSAVSAFIHHIQKTAPAHLMCQRYHPFAWAA